MASANLLHKVYTAEYMGVRNHVRLYVDTGEQGGGRCYHVTGTILRGMTYESKPTSHPESDQSGTFVPGSMRYVGEIRNAELEKLDEACRAVEPPGAQMRLNGSKIDPSKPLRRCGEWVEEVKEKILGEGLVVSGDASDDSHVGG